MHATKQGDIFWVQSESGIRHPHVVIRSDSDQETVVVCALTSNLNKASTPGNVVLDAGEANLPRPSVVEVSKISTVRKTQLGDYIGSLSAERVRQIEAGRRFVRVSFFAE